jgi:hypothetical protein
MLENKRDYSKEAAKSGVVRGGLIFLAIVQFFICTSGDVIC